MLLGMRSTLLSSFSPAALFAAGEQGVWYDPSDMTTLFTTSAGTTPVTAVETAVGLMLDKSQGLVLGPELVSNGGPNFGNTTGWSTKGSATLSVVSNKFRVESLGTFSGGVIGFATVVGRTYKVTAFAEHVSGGSIANVRLYKSDDITVLSNIVTLGTGTATVSGYFTATATTSYISPQSNASGVIIDWTFFSTKSIAGNHATQSIDAARPVLSARVNLLTKTEQFDDALWSKLNVTAASTTAVNDPLGGTTADIITLSAGTAGKAIGYTQTVPASDVRFSVCVRAGTHTFIQLINTGDSGLYANFNSLDGTVGATGARTSSSMVSLGDGWFRISAVFTPGTFSNVFRIYAVDSNTAIYGGTTSSTGTFYLWGADLRVANDTALPVYQRVNTSTDYDTTGFPMYLRFDGSDDCMIMPLAISTLNLNAWYGGRQTVAGGSGRYFFIGDSTGAINSLGGLHASVGYRWPENQSVVTGSNDISTKVISYQRPSTTSQTAYLNGVFMTPNTATTTTFTSATGRLGCRLETSAQTNFIAGRLYSLIIRGAATSAADITATETWVNGKTKAY